jgi:hypothetical protein
MYHRVCLWCSGIRFCLLLTGGAMSDVLTRSTSIQLLPETTATIEFLQYERVLISRGQLEFNTGRSQLTPRMDWWWDLRNLIATSEELDFRITLNFISIRCEKSIESWSILVAWLNISSGDVFRSDERQTQLRYEYHISTWRIFDTIKRHVKTLSGIVYLCPAIDELLNESQWRSNKNVPNLCPRVTLKSKPPAMPRERQTLINHVPDSWDEVESGFVLGPLNSITPTGTWLQLRLERVQNAKRERQEWVVRSQSVTLSKYYHCFCFWVPNACRIRGRLRRRLAVPSSYERSQSSVNMIWPNYRFRILKIELCYSNRGLICLAV